MAVKKEQKDVQVIKKKPRGGNSPVIGDNGRQCKDFASQYGIDENAGD